MGEVESELLLHRDTTAANAGGGGGEVGERGGGGVEVNVVHPPVQRAKEHHPGDGNGGRGTVVEGQRPAGG
ncbi:hypothetical protein E2562_036543 [Oryza meyeriana var. granulata]|uniref:DUF834 domain-containing protein n=1 Tax=Oryza meyeriana var. granulata TaxID=110450 RepID=A0A6G1DTS5_9ORYZ|nr:hypothetical protein E2562_036543 [Oryza meyeriana var. granulata]